MDQSPRLSLSYVAPAQAQKHVTVNESFRRLDVLVQMTVKSRTVAAEPASPAEGDGYILPASPSGAAWDNFAADNLAFYQDGAWISVTRVQGMRAYVVDEGDLVAYDGAAWSPISVGEEANQFGVNTAADATNRLAVKSDAALFSHDDVTPGTGDVRVKINKAAAGDTASHLFQTGFSGRAEFGLTGDDDFHVKVSPDGASWRDALVIDKDTGDTAISDRVLSLIGTNAGNTILDIDCEGTSSPFRATRYHAGFPGPVFFGRKGRGTRANPEAVRADDTLVGFRGYGFDGTAFTAGGGSSAAFLLEASENHSASAHGGQIRFFTIENGNAGGGVERVRFSHDGAIQMGGANTVIDKNRHHQLRSYTVAGLPPATTAGQVIYVSNATGGAVPAFSDGTNWRRVTDRAVVS